MQLIESVSRHLPMVFLVQIPNGHRVGEDLVQTLDACLAHFFAQSDWQLRNRSECPNFRGSLANLWAGSVWVIVKGDSGVSGFRFCFRAHNFWFVICSIKAACSDSISPSYRLSLIKKQGVPLTPLRIPLMRSPLMRSKIFPSLSAVPKAFTSNPVFCAQSGRTSGSNSS